VIPSIPPLCSTDSDLAAARPVEDDTIDTTLRALPPARIAGMESTRVAAGAKAATLPELPHSLVPLALLPTKSPNVVSGGEPKRTTTVSSHPLLLEGFH